jgi:DNA-binding transcriptional LysR family regulator
MRLTSEGEALLRYCQAAQELEGEARAKIHQAGLEREVRICITGQTSAIHTRVIPQCVEVLKKYTNLLFQFDFSDDLSGANKLRTGFAHLAILPKEHVALEMDSKLLRPARYILIGPASWKKRALKEIVRTERIVDFDPNDEMTFRYLQHFNLLKSSRSERHFASNTNALAEMIAMGYGYTVLPETFAFPLLQSKKAVDLHPKHEFHYELALAWYPRPEMPAYFKALVQAIK